MVTTVILVLVLIVVLFLLFKYLTGRKKPSDQRSAWEKIACSLFVISRKNVEDAANNLRTARVMKTEALQEVDDAMSSLQSSYKENMISLKTALKQMSEVTLPKLKDQPGKLEAKARKAKKDYQASVDKGSPIEAHKNNAKRYLQLKNEALENIKKSEKLKEKLEVTIETSKAEYEGKMIDLEMIKSNLECMVDIPQIELNQSLGRIRSLQNELSNRMNQDQIRAEVESEVSREDNSSSYSSDVEDEFNNL